MRGTTPTPGSWWTGTAGDRTPHILLFANYLCFARDKEAGRSLPKVLGLTACLMVKSVTVDRFHQEKDKLEKVLDCRVETTEDLYAILKYVTCPQEKEAVFRANTMSQTQDNIVRVCGEAATKLATIYTQEKEKLRGSGDNINYRQTAKDDLDRHYKVLKNDILSCIQNGLLNIGLIAIKLTYSDFKLRFRKVQNLSGSAHYNLSVKTQMGEVMEGCFQELDEILNPIHYNRGSRDLQALISLSSYKLLKLIEILKDRKENLTIVFVDQKFR